MPSHLTPAPPPEEPPTSRFVKPPQLFDLPPVPPDPVIAACPVGNVLETNQMGGVTATAAFDKTRQYRYRLSHIWDGTLPRCVFVMLNPSTADAFKLDPTVTRASNFARSWGYGAWEVVNLFALRSTDPQTLYSHPTPVGDNNDQAIAAAVRAADTTVAAWGVRGELQGRGLAVRQLLEANDVQLFYLKKTKNGHPSHPLYLPATTSLKVWV